MGVRADDESDPPIEVMRQRLLLTGRLGMEIDHDRIGLLAERTSGDLALDRRERIVELILYPASDMALAASETRIDLRRQLRDLGLDLEVVTPDPKSMLIGESVGEAERLGKGAFFIVQIDRSGGQSIAHPSAKVKIEPGDAIMLVVRGSRLAAGAIFSQPAGRMRTGRGFA